MIKLKDIILEIKKGTKLPVFPISKQEEMEALDTIKKILVPRHVQTHTKYGSKETIDSIKQKLRKIKIYKRQGITRGMMYSTRGGIWWLIQKDKEGRLEIIDQNGQSYRIGGQRSWIPGWHQIDTSVNDDLQDLENLQEGQESPERLKISRKEEYESVDFIKKVAIPYAVEHWNKKSPLHWQIKNEDLTRDLKKFGITSGLDGDIITYVVHFKFTGGTKINSREHNFVFRIYKMMSGKYDKLAVSLTSNLQKAGDRAWNVRLKQVWYD